MRRPTADDRFEIKPNAKRNAMLLGLGSVAFTIGGFWMVADGSGTEVFAGILCVVFFGGAGLLVVPKLLRRDVSMVLTPEGIEQITLYGTAKILWEDVEQVGVWQHNLAKMVGIRLKSHDNYLAHMSPQLSEFLTKSLPFMQIAGVAAWFLDASHSFFVGPIVGTFLSKLTGESDIKDSLLEFTNAKNLATALEWQRKNFGYDILLSWTDLDRSANGFVSLLEHYQNRAGQLATRSGI